MDFQTYVNSQAEVEEKRRAQSLGNAFPCFCTGAPPRRLLIRVSSHVPNPLSAPNTKHLANGEPGGGGHVLQVRSLVSLRMAVIRVIGQRWYNWYIVDKPGRLKEGGQHNTSELQLSRLRGSCPEPG